MKEHNWSFSSKPEMQNVEDHIIAWIGLGSATAGALISFLSTSFSNRQRHKQELEVRKFQQEQNRRDIRRERLEELYVLAKHWAGGIGSNYLSLSGVMQDKITYNEHLDLIIEWGEKSKVDFSRLEMIVDIYGAPVRSAYDRIIAERGELNKIAAKFKHDYEKGQRNGKSYLKSYVAAQNRFEAAEVQFLSQISDAASSS